VKVGVQLVWVVDSDADLVTEHRPNSQSKIRVKNDTLACEDIIPGFRLSLAELFRA
jgi:Uma2 family endonuclease